MGAESFFAKPGFKAGKSLRFNDDDSARLSRTFTSAGNTKKWTFSCWVKRGEIDGQSHTLFATDRSGTNDFDYIRIQTDDSVYAAVYSDDEEYHLRIITNRKLRDLNTWYHIVVRYDSTAGTPASPENALYINGVLEDDLAAGVTPDQNAVSNFNNNVVHRIGNWNANAAFNLDGHLAEVNFVDGYSLPASYFGETDTVGNQWIPIKYSGAYGNNGFYLSFAGGGLISATGGTITTDGDFKVHSFTSNGTFTPTITGHTESDVEYLVIAGGGGGGAKGGGGGAGGFRTGFEGITSGTGYGITIGAGGAGGTGLSVRGVNGANSVFDSVTSVGGGGGGSDAGVYRNGSDGGSGGGVAGGGYGDTVAGGDATSGQGNAGGNHITSSPYNGGGGGGAGAVGATNGNGGAGLASSITGSSVTRAGGGGGGGDVSGGAGAAGSGGGGAGAGASDTPAAGTVNTGGGGGGGGNGGGHVDGAAGGTGIVIIRYRFQ